MNIGNFILPILVFSIIFYGFIKKVDIYESFIVGAKEGLVTVFNIFPSILAMMFAVNIFLKSNALNYILEWMNPIFNLIHIPTSIIPMAILRPISGNASLAVLTDLFTTFGPDSFIGRLASTIQGCTDTTIYILALYFGSVKITKTKHALVTGLFADLVGIIASIVVVTLIFS